MPTNKKKRKARHKKRGEIRTKKAKTITNEQAEAIKQRVDTQTGLILQFCIETGLRISDVLNLRAVSLNQCMEVREAKTGKFKIVELSDELWEKLRPIKQRVGFKIDLYAFRSPVDERKHIHRSTIHRRIKKTLRGLNFDASAHSARKLYAQNILNATGSLQSVQRALNHNSILTTATYLDIDLGQLIHEAKKNGSALMNGKPTTLYTDVRGIIKPPKIRRY